MSQNKLDFSHNKNHSLNDPSTLDFSHNKNHSPNDSSTLDFSHIKNYVSGDSSTPDFSWIAKNNPSGWILQADLTEKTGGLINSGTAANRSSQGRGIRGGIIMGKRKKAYPVQGVIEFLYENYRLIDDES